MNLLKLHIRNCYGIGALDKDIDLSRGACIIYAPNGTMKSSLTKVFEDIATNKESVDRIYQERVSDRSILIDDIDIDPESIYVFKNEDANGEKWVSTFLTNPDLKQRYDKIHKELADAKKILRTEIKKISGSSDIEAEILHSFKESENSNIYDCFLYLKESVNGIAKSKFNFKYNDVFDKAGKVKEFIAENEDIVMAYFSKYNDLLSRSTFFSHGENSFGTNQADALIASVEDNRFFKANHKLTLSDGSVMSDKGHLKERVKHEIEVIFNDEELKEIYSTLEKKLSRNQDLKKFKEAIKNNRDMINRLSDYELLRKDVIVGYLQQSKDRFNSICNLYESKREELRNIIEDANAYTERWNNVIDLFNARFFVPFKAKVANLPDILLNKETASLVFEYQDENGADIKVLENTSLKHLSQGELRAYNIMQNIFVIEGLKEDGKEHLLIMDDVADSFDYKNKYAILEYMYDILQHGSFKLMILTHNFDFYRTAVSRLKINSVFFANRKNDRILELGQGLWKEDILKNKIIKKAHDNDRSFISLIPFARNIIEYSKGQSSPEFSLLTACLHDKDNSATLTKGEIYDCMKPHLMDLRDMEAIERDKYYIDTLSEATTDAITDLNEIEITNKLVLSIAIRIKAEKYIKSKLTEEQLRDVNLRKDQTGNLCNAFKKYYSALKPKECLLINKVLMLTSENIHLNNFMFEPIVDMPIKHLKDLYNEVDHLLNN